MALLQQSPAAEEKHSKRHIVYPAYIVRGGKETRILLPAFPDWEIKDVSEAKALTRARSLVTEYTHLLEQFGMPLPGANDGGQPERYSEIKYFTIELADRVD